MGKDKKDLKDKKRGHDADDHDQKKRKKEKKAKHSSNRKTKDTKTEQSKPSELAGALSWGLLTFPKLLDELPQMLAALDAGQLVNIDSLSNKPLKGYLEKLFVLLPLRYSSGDGWYKDKDSGIKSISGCVLHRLVQTGAIVQPSDLTAGQQSAATRATLVLLKVMDTHPELASELPALLEGIGQGQAVRLGGIQDPHVRAQVVGLLRAVGVCHDGDSDDDEDEGEGGDERTWMVPSSDQCGGPVRAALTSLVAAINAAGAFAPLGPTPTVETNSSRVPSSSGRGCGNSGSGTQVCEGSDSGSSSDDDGDGGNDGDSSSSSSQADGNHRDSRQSRSREGGTRHTSEGRAIASEGDGGDKAEDIGEDRGGLRGAPRVGPMRPSNAQLAAAAQLAAQHPHQYEDEEDDEVGPLPQAPSRMAVTASALYTGAASVGGVGLGDGRALNTLGGDVAPKTASSSSSSSEFRVRDISRGADSVVGDVEGDGAGVGAVITEREEWMINPGEDRGIAGFETFGVSRKFNTGKLAKKVNEGLAAEREALERAMEGSEESRRTKAVMEEYRERRGASLMERHAADRADEAARKGGGGGGVRGERRAFDRDVDVLGRRTVGQQQVQQLVEHAKELDSRFDKGSVQRSFL